MAYHFVGIKGTGMAALAEILYDEKKEVRGSDIEKYIFTQDGLEEEGSRSFRSIRETSNPTIQLLSDFLLEKIIQK